MKSLHARIKGRVQGVGYRAWTIETATSLGLKGWVRNRKDGSVEAVFQGDERRLQQMIDKCFEGPFLARVVDIQTREIEEEPFDRFSSKSTL
ncbi:acylphosphatase [Sneathiella sp.]|jgi:acylphosphatase|uniref:acylphosphatase n=1 Tax=Sneathiella sp. TaxID=1964365 RepID=UPI0039E61E72